MSTGVCAYNFTVWILPVTLLGKEWKGGRGTSTGVCAYNFTVWILPVCHRKHWCVCAGKGMEGWEGDKHWCVCLQFHCMDLACDTAGNGMEGWEGDEHGCVYLKLHCVDLACDIAP